MDAQKVEHIAFTGAAAAALVFFAVATWAIWPLHHMGIETAQLVAGWTPKKGHVDQAIDQVPATVKSAIPTQAIANLAGAAANTVGSISKLEPVVSQAITDTATQLNRPCKGAAGPDACGTLAQANKTMIDAGDAIVTTQIGERVATKQIVATMKDLDQDAGDLDVTLKDQAVHQAAANLALAAGNLATDESTTNGILLDVKKETDAMVAPKTRTQRVLGVMPAAVKLGAIGACLATGTPCP